MDIVESATSVPGALVTKTQEIGNDIRSTIETGLVAAGLDSPGNRFVVGAVASLGLSYYFKPVTQFTPDGAPRPFSLFDKSPESTPMPWWLTAVFGGMVFGALM